MPPEVASAIGTTINIAIWAAWRAKIPKFKRESWVFLRMDLNDGGDSFNVLEVLIVKGVGTIKRTTKIAVKDKKPVSIKIPGTPIKRLSIGAPIKDKAKVMPISISR